MNEAVLRENVRSRLADGRLPHDRIGRVSATYGAGEVCDACAALVSTGQVLYRLQRAGVRQPLILFHSACFSMWKAERDRLVPRG
jgi:hypothetical protein